MTPNELVLTFGGLHVCVQCGKNRRRNATVRVPTDGQTHAQTQNEFIICPMLYAIAMGQIKIAKWRFVLTFGAVRKLRSNNTVHLCLVGKRVVDFLLVLIELFRQLSLLRRYEQILW